MKIVHVSTSDHGGAGIAASRLHIALLERGIDSSFLTLHKFSKHIPQHVQFLPGTGFVFPIIFNCWRKIKRGLKHFHLYTPPDERSRKYYLKNRLHGFEHFSFPFAEVDLANHPLVKEADVVHLHWVSDGFLDYTKFFSKRTNNVVWTLHDMNPFTGGCHHSDDCLFFKDKCQPCFQLKNTIDENYAAKMLQLKLESFQEIKSTSIRIVTPSKWIGDLSSVSALFKKFIHHVIPNGFDPQKFQLIPRDVARKKLNVEGDKKIIFINAHHIDNYRKGLSYLVKALNNLEKDKFILMVAGHTMRPELFPNLLHLGYLHSEEEMSIAYSAADVFVLPSLAENLPNTICESLFCGTPVVAFDTGGIKELLNEANGLLIPLRDFNALSEGILAATSCSWNREAIREDAIARFGKNKVAADYLSVYHQLIETK